jgi:hypothetical protein
MEPIAKPLKYFIGNPADIITKEDTYHAEKLCLCKKIIEFEISKIIDPVLTSNQIDKSVKERLLRKKLQLTKAQEKLNQLAIDVYAKALGNLKQVYMNTIAAATKAGDTLAVERLKERAAVLVKEHKECEQPAPSAIDADDLFKNYDCLSIPQQLATVRKRKDEFWNMTNYVYKEIVPQIDNKEEKEKKQSLVKDQYIPVLNKAKAIIQTLESGQKVEGFSKFLNTELVEVTPTVFHGMTPTERLKSIEDLQDKVHKCIALEENYRKIHEGCYPNPNEMPQTLSRKFRDSEKNVTEYTKLIDILDKMKQESQKWVPLPLLEMLSEIRPIQIVNPNVKPNVLIITFKSMSKCSDHKYYIKYQLDVQGQIQTFTTGKSQNLVWNEGKEINIGNEKQLDKKMIQVAVYESGVFSDSKKAEGNISLAKFLDSNLITAAQCLENNKYELNYEIKIREPMNKIGKANINKIILKARFSAFNKAAPVPGSMSQSQPVNTGPPVNIQTNNMSKSNPANQSNNMMVEEEVKEPIIIQPSQKKDPWDITDINMARCFADMSKKTTFLSQTPASELPPGIAMEYFLSPINAEKLCLSFVLKFAEELEKVKAELLAECRTKDQRIVGSMWSASFRHLTLLQAKMENQEIAIEEYKSMIEEQISIGKKLLPIYKAKGAVDHYRLTAKKLEYEENEFKELEGM